MSAVLAPVPKKLPAAPRVNARVLAVAADILLMAERGGRLCGHASKRGSSFTVTVGMPARERILVRCATCPSPPDCACLLPPCCDVSTRAARYVAEWIVNHKYEFELEYWD